MAASSPIVILLLLVGPILAIIALTAVRRLEAEFGDSSLQHLTSRIYALEQRLAAIEPSIATSPAPRQTSATPHSAEPNAPPKPSPEPSPDPSIEDLVQVHLPPPPLSPAVRTPPTLALHPGWPGHQTDELDLESRIAGKWFNRVGIVAVLISVSYFLKLAFDNNW